MDFRNEKLGMSLWPLEPGDPGYGPESRAFLKAFMEAEPGDAFDTAIRENLNEVAAEWDRVKAKETGTHGEDASGKPKEQ